MPRPKNTDRRQAQIVEGLLQVMAEHGYERASTSAIAEAAGLSSGLVHYHFKNKQGVLLSLVARLAELILVRYRQRAGNARDPWERLDAFVDAHLALDGTADPAAVSCWVSIGAEALRQPEVAIAYREAVRADLTLLESLVADVLATEGASIDAAPSIAAGLLAAIQGSYQLAVAARATPVGYAAPAVRQMARGLIRAEVTT